MINESLTFLGFMTDNAFPHVDGFWSTPVGLFITALLAIRHFFYSRSRVGIRGIWHGVMATTWFIAFVGGITPGYDPHHIVQSVLFLLCLETMIDVYHHIKEKLHASDKV